MAVGPARGSPLIWYYDTLDVARYLKFGRNEIRFVVLRYFVASRGAMPFARTAFPGLTVVGRTENDGTDSVDLSTGEDWVAQADDSIKFPLGLVDDVFLHVSFRAGTALNILMTVVPQINERVTPTAPCPQVAPKKYGIKTLNGELAPWRLRPRSIPMPEQTHIVVDTVRACASPSSSEDWSTFISGSKSSLILPSNSSHTLEIQANVHSTAFLRWTFKAVAERSQINLKITYSEGYELKPRSYPFFRTKEDRLGAIRGQIIGPYDEVILDLPNSQIIAYEPFWFRTFRIMRLEITAGPEPIELLSFDATQVNYPLDIKAGWIEPGDPYSEKIWDVSIRTMRNCIFDGYSDCPFYEQLQYSGDTYPVGLFHYLLSGDDRLMRQAITNFAASVTTEGLTQSRFPSQVPQIIAGFPLYWILQVCDHHLFFGDRSYARSFLPRIDGVLDFFDSHIDDLGLVSGLPEDVWQYVDWVTTWGATDEHPDKGVPTSGRKNNRHTFFSLLYAYVLKKTARLVRDVGRPGYASEYESRANDLLVAVRTHCYDGQFFTDSTSDMADELSYSQHCQAFAVLSGAASADISSRLLRESFVDARFSKCSYFMQFYALRAFAIAGDDVYESFWPTVWQPWRSMLAQNLTTWEEDNVRQRSDCHAWGSVPIYEYCTELAGIRPIAPGSSKVLFKPRLRLSESLTAKVALGKANLATVSWITTKNRERHVELRLEKPVEVVSQLPGGRQEEHGLINSLQLVFQS